MKGIKVSPYVYPYITIRSRIAVRGWNKVDKPVPQHDLLTILQAVSLASGVPIDLIQGNGRQPEIVDARHVFCYVAAKDNWGERQISEMIGIGRSSVPHAKKKVKNYLETSDKRVMSYYYGTIEILKQNEPATT
jgi:chromosomal replication initiation ATPase DnaA